MCRPSHATVQSPMARPMLFALFSMCVKLFSLPFLRSQLFVEEDVEVAIMIPFFPAYLKQVEDLAGKVVFVPTLPNCRPSADLLKKTLLQHPKIKCFLINDPCNPTGALTNPYFISYSEVSSTRDQSFKALWRC